MKISHPAPGPGARRGSAPVRRSHAQSVCRLRVHGYGNHQHVQCNITRYVALYTLDWLTCIKMLSIAWSASIYWHVLAVFTDFTSTSRVLSPGFLNKFRITAGRYSPKIWQKVPDANPAIFIQVKASPGDRLRSYLEQNECTSTVFIWVLVSNFICQCLYRY